MASFAESSVRQYSSIYDWRRNKRVVSLWQDTATISFSRFLINVKS